MVKFCDHLGHFFQLLSTDSEKGIYVYSKLKFGKQKEEVP